MVVEILRKEKRMFLEVVIYVRYFLEVDLDENRDLMIIFCDFEKKL